MAINRRTFFRGMTLGVGGLYLAPFLREVDAAKTDTKPARVLFFVQGNGLYVHQIQPKGLDRPKKPTAFEERKLTDYATAFSLEPLRPWASKMTLLSGLSGKVAIGGHGMGFAALGCWPERKNAYGTTIDAALGMRLGGILPHVGVGVANSTKSMEYSITSIERGKAKPTLLDPMLALRQYFAAGAAGASRKQFDVNTGLMEFLADDVKRLQPRLNSREKEKLDRYLEAFESMSGRQSKLASLADRIAAATPEIDPSKVKPAATMKGQTGSSGVFDRLEAQCEIAAGTMIAGLTNVATISIGAGPGTTGISCTGEEVGKGSGLIGSHGIGHGGSMAGMSSTECHERIRRKCLEKLAMFIRRLESIPEGDGTMLDNTLIVFMSDQAEGHHPGCTDWPFVLIGDLGGRLKLGDRYLRYPWYGKPGHRTIASLYTSLLNAVGDHRQSFGYDDVAIADIDQSGPLAEIMV